MGNSFVIRGLRDEAAHDQRDVDFRQTRVGERPDENEVVETKTLKSAESYTNTGIVRINKDIIRVIVQSYEAVCDPGSPAEIIILFLLPVNVSDQIIERQYAS